MLNALFLSIGQLADRRIVLVFLKSLAVTVIVLAGLGAGIWYGAAWLAAWWGLSGQTSALVGVAATIAALLAAWVLFRAVAVAVIGVFADEVVMAVEARHYPDAHSAARDVPLGRSVIMGLGSAMRAIGINLLMSPVYLVLLVTGVGTAAAFFIVNGWLLGRDLADMVAARHMPVRDLRSWRSGNRFARFGIGLAGTALFSVPVVNLFAPIIGAAMATHWFHRRSTDRVPA